MALSVVINNVVLAGRVCKIPLAAHNFLKRALMNGVLSKKCCERKIKAAMIMSVGKQDKRGNCLTRVYWVLENGIVTNHLRTSAQSADYFHRDKHERTRKKTYLLPFKVYQPRNARNFFDYRIRAVAVTIRFWSLPHEYRGKLLVTGAAVSVKRYPSCIIITLENSVFETFFIINQVLKAPIVPKVPFITKTEF
jgi:hypothetical protein